MNFDFSDELKQLRDQARKFLAEHCPPAAARRVLEGDRPYDRGLWLRLAEMGWLGAAVPEEFGGAGLGHEGLCVLAEELGRALAPVPVASSIYLVTETILAAGSATQKAAYLPGLVAGERIGTLALAEGIGNPDPARIETTVSAGKISGIKLPVADGGIADLALVLAREGGQPALFLVDLAGPGVARATVATIDPSRDHARITFTEAPAEPLGAAGEGWAILRRALDRAAILVAFEQIGGAQACLEMARDYALERYAFGRPIGSFQAIKHKVVSAAKRQDIASFGMDLMGMAGAIADPALAPMQGLFQEALLDAPGLRIAGGTDEVLRNVIAERVLGLPGDIRVDKDVPYNKIPTGRG
ncbi:MAG: hypothetical protein QOJ54_896 [Aliidongia sp.]|nr:hypothetical protein [Aliidongia sp.]